MGSISAIIHLSAPRAPPDLQYTWTSSLLRAELVVSWARINVIWPKRVVVVPVKIKVTLRQDALLLPRFCINRPLELLKNVFVYLTHNFQIGRYPRLYYGVGLSIRLLQNVIWANASKNLNLPVGIYTVDSVRLVTAKWRGSMRWFVAANTTSALPGFPGTTRNSRNPGWQSQ